MTTTAQPPAIRLITTEAELCNWLGRASPGDILEYHRGFLPLDTAAHGSRLPDRDRAELVRAGRRAFWAWEKGLAHLVQRRGRVDEFVYLVVARAKSPRSPEGLVMPEESTP